MLKCIAIDDEPIALNIIESYCQQHGEIQLETFTSPQEGMNRIKEISPDIVFMDIEMTGYSGIELAKELPADSALIFTTAYANYALEGFDVDAVDFLHKPYFYERFCRAIQKAEQWQRQWMNRSWDILIYRFWPKYRNPHISIRCITCLILQSLTTSNLCSTPTTRRSPSL